MKKKTDNLKNTATGDLSEKLAALREQVRAIAFNIQGSKIKNVKEVSSLKKEIARILTEMNKNNKNK